MARTAVPSRLRPQQSSAPQRRPKLSHDDLELLAKKMRETYGWNTDPKPFQLAGVQAQLEGVDMIIQASTGAGKTAIAAGPHLMSTSIDDVMIQRILSSTYQIVLISPEMLQSRTFINRILRNTKFARQILSVVVDEAHCISHWGANFRKKYGSLGIIRAFLARGTPIIAFSATLTPRVRRDVSSKLHFPKSGGAFLNVGNDRPNVSIVVRACEHPMNSLADLDFVVPPGISRDPSAISKTYLYSDNINIGSDIVDYLRARLISQCQMDPDIAAAAIRPFNATMSHKYRTESIDHFRRGLIRVLVCTDAAGMGCNVSDVDVVVQWKLPATLSNFIQRAGRAARSSTRTGLAVLLVERSAFASDISRAPRASRGRAPPGKQQTGPVPAQPDPTNPPHLVKKLSAKESKAAKKKYAEAHGIKRGSQGGECDAPPDGDQPPLNPDSADEGLITFIQSVECRRTVWAKVYDSQPSRASSTDLTAPCCDICDPLLLDRTRPGPSTRVDKPKTVKRGQPVPEFSAALQQWCNRVYARDHQGSQWDATAILDSTLIEGLTSVGPLDKKKLTTMLQASWIWWDEYGNELATLVSPWQIPVVPLERTSKKAKRPVSGLVSSRAKRARLGFTAGDNESPFASLEWTEPLTEAAFEDVARAPHPSAVDYSPPAVLTWTSNITATWYEGDLDTASHTITRTEQPAFEDDGSDAMEVAVPDAPHSFEEPDYAGFTKYDILSSPVSSPPPFQPSSTPESRRLSHSANDVFSAHLYGMPAVGTAHVQEASAHAMMQWPHGALPSQPVMPATSLFGRFACPAHRGNLSRQ
ncbi:ATP-dependent DNA helicase Q5 [Trametes pubescens]|uniref:DNA 3'-5' helicase n=1 Tax=Trametes pubescens TaxID=154538 RepID=A0A1M2VHN3_TRAPU|nr:ATP-dependent DNA helicase Q5 [Trametes pubescens]